MRELVYFVAVSLDGRIASADGDFSAFPVAGDHIDWIIRDYPETLSAPALAALGLTVDEARFDTVVMGWNTYAVGLPFGVDDPYPHLRQIVFSRQEREVPDGITLAIDPLATVRALKEQDGADIWLCGGGVLASAVIDEIDRLVFKVNPVMIGGGLPVIAGVSAARDFELTGSTAFASGVVVNEYRRILSAS